MVNRCLNCNEICKDKFCDSLCKYGYSFQQYRKLDKKEKEE